MTNRFKAIEQILYYFSDQLEDRYEDLQDMIEKEFPEYSFSSTPLTDSNYLNDLLDRNPEIISDFWRLDSTNP